MGRSSESRAVIARDLLLAVAGRLIPALGVCALVFGASLLQDELIWEHVISIEPRWLLPAVLGGIAFTIAFLVGD